MPAQHEIVADFNALSDYPADGIQHGIPLGYVCDDPEHLSALADGTPVILAAPDVFARGHIRRIATPEGDYLYGVVDGPFQYRS